ncbi:hypothetical protein MYAM1_001032 [Malassezia yamatoensis]|uniref:Uncharacterized protein n=1 Tax=Malassezia yamatoensis TaxID=253288 RepID=A0AAJ6CHY4_9BASI|nr:hypothetical protein MYAM1_001032 [Malassezia yamatoensis]
MSGGGSMRALKDSSDTPVSLSDSENGGGTLSQRFQYRPYDTIGLSDSEEAEPAMSNASQPFLGSDAAHKSPIYERLGILGTIPVLILYLAHWLLTKWKAILFTAVVGVSAALLIFNMSRPEWREMAYYRVDPNARVPLDTTGEPILVRPSHPIIPPKMHQCPGPHGRVVPLSPTGAHPTPKTHPLAIVGDHKLVGLDDEQCVTYVQRYGMYTDEALNITYRLPDELLPKANDQLIYDEDPDNPLPVGRKKPRTASVKETRERLGYDTLHGMKRDFNVPTSVWENRLREDLARYNTRSAKEVYVPDWRQLMDNCYAQRLAERGLNNTDVQSNAKESMSHMFNTAQSAWDSDVTKVRKISPQSKRTALVLRSYEGYPWREDDILNLRALISELSLNNPNTPYDIRILVEVKNRDLSVFTSEWDRYRVLVSSVPREFWGIVDFWTEKELEVLYAGLPGRFINNMIAQTSYRSCLMALQKFWLDHQEYDYIYNWEMDVRYIGNYLDFFEGIEEYSRREPLVPGMNKYDTWYVRNVSRSEDNWRSSTTETSGMGEEADMITLGPIFDPRGSGWYWTHDVQNYPRGRDTDRRASIGTNMRLSRGLLEAMNVVNAEAKKSLHCEAWPTTLVLHSQMERSEDHSFYPTAGFTYSLPLPFKGVFAPHPIYFRHEWDPRDLDRLLNRQNFYMKKNENLHKDSSFYYHSQHSKELYMGWKGNDNVCRAPSLLHPIKRVDYVHDSTNSNSQ